MYNDVFVTRDQMSKINHQLFIEQNSKSNYDLRQKTKDDHTKPTIYLSMILRTNLANKAIYLTLTGNISNQVRFNFVINIRNKQLKYTN